MRAFLYNLLLALVWVIMSGRFTPASLVLGFVMGYLLLLFAQRVTGPSPYFHKLAQAVAFVLFVMWELVKANFRVASVVITPRHSIRPGIVAVPLDVKTDVEITLLANLITMTPGSVSLDVSSDRRVLYVHTMHLTSVEEFRREVKLGFERRIKELFE